MAERNRVRVFIVEGMVRSGGRGGHHGPRRRAEPGQNGARIHGCPPADATHDGEGLGREVMPSAGQAPLSDERFVKRPALAVAASADR
jgi:hypothetical protein